MAARRGNGAGWGGPAKGAGKPKAPQFSEGNRAASTVVGLDRKARQALREERAAKMEDVLFDIAVASPVDATRVQAAARLHAIYEGQPVARTITHTVDDIGSLSDDALRAEMARLRGAGADAAAGGAPEGVPPESDGILH